MDLEHAHKSATRFHKATLVIASHLMGLPIDYILGNNTNLPIVINKDGKNIACVSLGKAPGDSDFIAPYIVNAAFSLELNLKLLIFLETKNWPRKHDLLSLFKSLSKDRQKKVSDSFEEISENSPELKKFLDVLEKSGFKIEWKLINLLERSSKAFEKWRYAFEGNAGCFAGYSQIHQALRKQIEEFE